MAIVCLSKKEIGLVAVDVVKNQLTIEESVQKLFNNNTLKLEDLRAFDLELIKEGISSIYGMIASDALDGYETGTI